MASYSLKRIGFYSFLEEDEYIKQIFRRPFTFAFIKFSFRFLIWGGIFFLIFRFFPVSESFPYLRDGVVTVAFLWTIYKTFGVIFFWYYNAMLVTNENVVVIDWPEPFRRSSTSIDFHNLDEIEVERNGFFSFVLNYGNLHFKKIGGDLLAFECINRPQRVTKYIEVQRETAVDSKNFTEESSLKGLLSQLVQKHVGEHGQPDREKPLQTKSSVEVKAEIPDVEVVKLKKTPHKSKPVIEEIPVEIEKRLDDDGGFEIDLSEDE